MDVIWLNRDNTIDKAIRVDGTRFVDAPYPLTGANKVKLLLIDRNDVSYVFDSDANPTFFSTTTTRVVDGQDRRVISLILGACGLDPGAYEAVLSIFDSVHTTGLVVGQFKVQVREAQ